MDSPQYVTPSVSANRLRTSLGGEGNAETSKMAAAASQGGRAGGGGGSSGAGGGSGCGTGSSRSGLLDKVRSRFLGTVEAWGAPGRQRVLPISPPFSSAASQREFSLAHRGNLNLRL